MGDRCYCSLKLGGILRKEHIPALATALIDANVDEYSNNQAKVEAALQKGEAHFGFYEVNYAQMDDALASLLPALKLSYACTMMPEMNTEKQTSIMTPARMKLSNTISAMDQSASLSKKSTRKAL